MAWVSDQFLRVRPAVLAQPVFAAAGGADALQSGLRLLPMMAAYTVGI
jgi:hypothetical protein